VGEVEVLWIEATERHRDSDLGVNSYEEELTRELLLCPVRGKPITEPHCSFQVPLSLVSEYGPITLPKDLSPEERAELAGIDAPTKIERDETMLEVELSARGKVTVVLRKGSLPESGPALGEHSLW
jgi:hypothetical protein